MQARAFKPSSLTCMCLQAPSNLACLRITAATRNQFTIRATCFNQHNITLREIIN